ncbi:MAG: RraA family protein, partial [Chloroflexota bacterium]
LWGGLMTIRAQVLESAGVVADGYIRDTHEILDLGFPTFAYGSFAQDQGSRGKVVDYRVPIEIQGIRITPGDLIFGDVDGVCIIPRDAEEAVFTAALEKARGEQTVKKAIEGGMSAREAFDTYGIL